MADILKATVFPKAESGASRTFSGNRIALEAPSVVQLQTGPEHVARFERHGNDLILILDDGTALTIENFFVATPEGRNDLVFEDANEVTWWAQYGETWTGFDIAEINTEAVAPAAAAAPPPSLPMPLLAGLGLLAGGVAGAVALGKGGGGHADAPAAPAPTSPAAPPQGAADPARTAEDTPFHGVVTGTSPGGGDLTFGPGGAGPQHGAVTVNPDGSYTYTPNPDYHGPDSFEVTISDGHGGTATVTVPVDVTPVDDIVPDDVTTRMGEPVTTPVLANDGFEDPDARISAVTQGGHGTVTVNPDGTVTYTPEAGYTGGDSYTYTVTSGGTEETTTVTVTITHQPPVAEPDVATTPEDTPVSGNLLTNDHDPEGNPIAVTGFEVGGSSYHPGDTATIPDVGTILIDGNGDYTFTPAADWNGQVPTITYTVSDGNDGGPVTSTLDIEVTPVDDPPAAGSDPIDDQGNEDADGITQLDASAFFSNVDGHTLTYSADDLPEGLSIDPDTGIISGTIDRSASHDPDHSDGAYHVTVTATDGTTSIARTFTWTVINPPPVANDDEAHANKNHDATGNVLTGAGAGDVADSDPDGDSLTVTGFIIDGDATVHHVGDPVAIMDSDGVTPAGTFTLGDDGAYTFTPEANWAGTVPTITYTIDDGEDGTATADLVITVSGDNNPPVPNDTIADQANADADGVSGLDTSDFFSDIDGDTLHYSASNLPDGLTIDPDTGIISGTIDHSASQGGTDGVYSVTVTANDGHGGTVDQTFDWKVTNPAPVAEDDAATTNEDTTVTGNVIGGAGSGADDVADTDPDGDSLSVTGFTVAGDATQHAAGETVTIAGIGEFTLDSDGDYTFTPDTNWNGTVPTVTYTLSDSEGGTDTADLVITVTAVNDPPVIADGGDLSGVVVEAGNLDDGTVVSGTPTVSGNLSATDVENDSLKWSAINPDTTYGTFTIDEGTGRWIYELNNDLPATQALNEDDRVPLTFEVQVSDGKGGTDTRTVTITITGTNDSPVASPDTNAVTETGVVDDGSDGNTPVIGPGEAKGNVLTDGTPDSDVDAGEAATLKVSDVSFGGTAGTVGAALAGTYGSLVLNDDGTYTYTLDNTDPDTQVLKQGETATEVFSYTVTDANGATSTSTLTVTVTGTNDQPVITSDAAAAAGEVTEQGTANPDAESIVTGTLAASDVDDDATQTWSIATTAGTYGSIAIDPATGQWTYTLDNGLPATQALNTGDIKTETFTARVTDEHGAWSEQTITVTVNGSNDDLDGSGPETVTLTEDGTATGTLQTYIHDVDDTIVLTGFNVDTNGDGVDETFAPGDTATIKDGAGNTLGTLTIAQNGGYTFTPTGNYAGDVPTVTYTMAEDKPGGSTVTQTLDFEITKVSDVPGLEASKTVGTDEDTAVSLGLKAPEITDTGTGTSNDDNPERIGTITLTIGGAGASGVTLSDGTDTLTPVGGKITIVLTDVDHVTDVPAVDNANGIYYLTTSQYEALTAHPAAESGDNFTVTVNVTSYEVDGGGVIVPGVAGAPSSQTITVDVQAVTDGADLSASQTSFTFAEDSSVDVGSLLTAARTDAEDNGDGTTGNGTTDDDNSELYSYTVSGLQEGTVVTVDGKAYTAGASGSVTSDETNILTAKPSIVIKPPADFSGDMGAVTVTLNTRDTDGDSTGSIDAAQSSVTLDLHVNPVAGDVTASDVETKEDTAVAFLAGVKVTDTGTTTGSEVIDKVSFDVPSGWTVAESTVTNGASAGASFDQSGSTYTITFTGGTEAEREDYLKGFTITPSAHSSTDATIALSITSTDSNTVNGATASDTKTVDRDVTITVTPVAERTDTDSDGVVGNDVTMIGDHAYSGAGKEDTWFALGSNVTDASNVSDGYDLKTPWTNADADEFTYAVLTPTLQPDTAGDTVIGTKFRYNDGTTWHEVTYTGDPVWVPSQYLDTLQVKLPPDVSGTMTIGVQAGSVDYDDDAEVSTLPLDPPHVSGAGVDVAVSGSATLSLIKFDPVADAVTMALNGRASGLEDTAIPLSIKTTSSDKSETFSVTISDIPAGAKIVYGGTELAIVGGSVTILNFDNATQMSITPPLNSNDDFTLTVSAVSVDDGDILATPVSRTIDVSVTGVADTAVVTPAAAFSTTEAALDSGDHKVVLSDLVTSVTSPDNDGSEAVTLRITGLAEGFTLTGATTVVSGTGADRVWVVSANNLAGVSVVVPENYSGTVNLKVAGVTTENDGDSHTGVLTDVSFTVTPSPEATITTSATLVEDEITSLHLAIVHQNGDTDETLGNVYVATGYDTSNYTLYLGNTELSAAGLTTTDIGGVTYYVIPAGQVGDLGAKGAANLDGDVGSLDFKYDVIDPSSDDTLTAVRETKDGSLALSITPVTDDVHASIAGITTAGSVTGDTATVTASGAVTVNLHVDSDDTDGSEHLVRVLIDGVPDGVTVTGASQVGANSWLLVYDGAGAKAIGAGGINVPVEFVIGKGAADGTSGITMTVMAQDEGQSATTPAGIETDTVGWNLVLNLNDGEPTAPPVIDTWSYNNTSGTEDTGFTLASKIDAHVTADDPSAAYTYTVTVSDLPVGTTVNGMILTTVNGEPIWTATVTVPAGGDSQTALDGLMSSITITPPPNSNDNNADFSFDAKLTAAAVGGTSVVADTTADMPVTPVTDEAAVTVETKDVDEGETSVTATITVADDADGVHGTIVGGKLYVQVSTDSNDGGTLTDSDNNTISLSHVSGVDGVPDGDYYVVNVDTSGGSVNLTYTAPDGGKLQPGDVTFTAWAQTQETDAGNTETASATGTADVVIVNNGVEATIGEVSGNEAASSDKSNAIELTGLSVTLNDNDGSETIRSILLSGVPVGFLLYVGDNAGDATVAAQASNAGGDGTTNTWVLSDGGDLPAYVAILPAANWSGTLDHLSLVVESGESSLSTSRVDTVSLGAVTVGAVADGLTIDPTVSFGAEGQIIDLNLNASMVDPVAATASVPDGSTETTTLQLTGLGEHAAFYIGSTLIDADNPDIAVSYDAGTYTITGLSQDDLDKLGVVQAASATNSSVSVEAWTVESANGSESAHVTDTLTLSVTPTTATTGNDSFIWSGHAIDGKAGADTVALRVGEDVDHDSLSTLLKNVEVIDLSVSGANGITGGLSVANVAAITGANTGTLTIDGDGDDKVALSSATEWNIGESDGSGHITYTSTSGVTLLIDEDVTVGFADEGFNASSEAPAMMSLAAFSFGLASLDTADTHETPTTDTTPPVTVDDVLQSGSPGEDLTAALPAEHHDSPALSGGADAHAGYAESHEASFVPPLDDEHWHRVHHGG